MDLPKHSQREEYINQVCLAQSAVNEYIKGTSRDSERNDEFLKLITEYFKAQGAFFLLIDKTNSQILKTEYSTEWGGKKSHLIPFEDGLTRRVYENQCPAEIDHPSALPEYSLHLDGIDDLFSELLVLVPVSFGNFHFGVVGLVNPNSYHLQEQSLLQLIQFANAFAIKANYSLIMNEMETNDPDLKVSHAQLILSRNTLRSVFDNLHESVYLVDKDYILKMVNLNRAMRVGLAPAELVERHCYESFFGLSSPCPECLVTRTIATGKSQHRTNHVWAAEKRKRSWDLRSYAVKLSSEPVERVILVEKEITEIQQGKKGRQGKVLTVEKLAGRVAHEINNPLTAILANAQLLSLDLGPDEDEKRESIRLIQLAARRVHQVVENLQSLAVQGQLDLVPFDLNESLQVALSLVSHEFITQKVAIRFDRDISMPLFTGSRDHLQGVWINLLLNAIESFGEKPGEISIISLFNEGSFYIEFRDNGSGIAEKDLDKIFEPFFTTKKKKRGSGFGLALAQRVIQAHGGQIHVESSLGEGSRFTIILPERRMDQSEMPTLSDMELE